MPFIGLLYKKSEKGAVYAETNKARTKLIGERCILMTTFGDKIRKLRKEKKMTQQKLGMTRLYLASKKNRRK